MLEKYSALLNVSLLKKCKALGNEELEKASELIGEMMEHGSDAAISEESQHIINNIMIFHRPQQ